MSHNTIPFVTIYGDSISTLSGFTHEDGIFYDPNYSQNTGITSVEETWWMKVIHGLGGKLLINNSYAGSTVCRNGYQAASSPWRIAKLKTVDQTPDYILIYSGLNDVAFYRSPEEFKEDYSDMLIQLRELYSHAEVWCGTLCRGFRRNPEWPLFLNLDACQPLSLYNQSIRAAVSSSDCHLADLSAFHIEYSSLDGIHPDAKGMDTLAQLWLRCILN